MFCCTLLYVHSSITIILMGKRELVALLNLSSWCLVMLEWLFLALPWGCLRFLIVVFPDHTHLLFFMHCKSFYFILPASIQYQVTIGPPAKRHSNGGLLAGRWYTAFRCCRALLYTVFFVLSDFFVTHNSFCFF